ncbi:integral membrane protein [Cellulomonas flavigena DSM 20109]|uniref:Integral membrane protein n=1 Tax=Cellulomonas flavigena (strain ATCC 482 / DSM 20109 / BCRC 11376 / JCM 18109 / NBRC 3775 / NCIMB 8073 / NRS 134) TaxID=446466 RepID=D5UJU1_CELFN|nr:ABC transporter permease [Cellulomonas flavigena]ADG75729.1 integral membrane protein [Cellulomonas flavigena DSM 20109]
MTAAALPRTGRPGVGARTAGPSLGRLVAAEWTKLTSLRSTWWTAAVTVAVGGAITYAGANASSTDPGFEPTSDLATGLLLAQVGPLVLGVLLGAGEFRTGAFRTTYTLVPRRWPALVAQVVVLAAFAFALGTVTLAACVVGVVPAAASRDLPLDLMGGDTPGVMRGMVLFVVGMALLGFAIGALLRRTVRAVVTSIVVVLVLPIVLMTLGDPGVDPEGVPLTDVTVTGVVGTFTPGTAAQLMTMPDSAGAMPGSPDLGPVGGGLVLGAWVLLLLVVAGLRLRLRDVR